MGLLGHMVVILRQALEFLGALMFSIHPLVNITSKLLVYYKRLCQHTASAAASTLPSPLLRISFKEKQIFLLEPWIDLAAPSLRQALLLPDHRFPCGSLWWLLIQRRKSKASGFRAHTAHHAGCTQAAASFILPTPSPWPVSELLGSLCASHPCMGFDSSPSPCLKLLLLCPLGPASWKESTSLGAAASACLDRPPCSWPGRTFPTYCSQ